MKSNERQQLFEIVVGKGHGGLSKNRTTKRMRDGGY
jgi:hypothetical protein